jgi:hypothetical protein
MLTFIQGFLSMIWAEFIFPFRMLAAVHHEPGFIYLLALALAASFLAGLGLVRAFGLTERRDLVWIWIGVVFLHLFFLGACMRVISTQGPPSDIIPVFTATSAIGLQLVISRWIAAIKNWLLRGAIWLITFMLLIAVLHSLYSIASVFIPQ